jgi:hypothetical protein
VVRTTQSWFPAALKRQRLLVQHSRLVRLASFPAFLVCLAPLPACPIRVDKALVQWIPALKAGSFMILVSSASHTIGSQIPTKNFQYSQKKSNHSPDKPFHIPVTLHRTISWVFWMTVIASIILFWRLTTIVQR